MVSPSESDPPAPDPNAAAPASTTARFNQTVGSNGSALKRVTSLRSELHRLLSESLGESLDTIPGDRRNHLLECLFNFTNPLDENANGVAYLIESIARTIEHCAASTNPDEQAHSEERFAAARTLHNLASRGDREALARAIAGLKQLIRDVKALRSHTEALQELSANAQSELNKTEHNFFELRDLHEDLLLDLVEHVDSGRLSREAQTVVNRSAGSLLRVESAKDLLAMLAKNGGGRTGPGPDPQLLAERDQLTARVIALQTELQAAVAQRDGLRNDAQRTAALEQRTQQLEQRNRELEQQLDRAPTADPAQAGRIDELEQERTQLERRVQELERSASAGQADDEAASGRESALSGQLAEVETERDGLAAELAAKQARVAELEAELGTQRSTVQTLEQAKAEAERIAVAAQAEAERLADRYDEEKSGLDSALEAKSQIVAELEARADAADRAEARLAELETELAGLQDQLAALEQENNRISEESAAKAADDQTEHLLARVDELARQRDELLAAQNEWLTERDNMQSLLDDYATSSQQQQGNLVSLRKALNEQGSELQFLSDERDRLQAELVQSRERLTMLEAELVTYKEETEDATQQVHILQDQTLETERALRQQIEAVEEQRLQEARAFEERLLTVGRERDQARSAAERSDDRGAALHAALVAACHQAAATAGVWVTACDELAAAAEELDFSTVRSDLVALGDALSQLADQDDLDAQAVAGPCTQLTERCRDLAGRIRDAANEISGTQEELAERSTLIDDLRATSERLRRELEEEQERVADATARADELDQIRSEQSQQLEQLRGAVAAAQSRCAELEGDLAATTNEAQTERSQLVVQASKAEKHIIELRKELDERGARMAQLEQRAQGAEGDRTRLAVALHELGSGLMGLIGSKDLAAEPATTPGVEAARELQHLLEQAATAEDGLAEHAGELAGEGLALARAIRDDQHRLAGELAVTSEQAERSSAELATASGRIEELEGALATLRGELTGARDELVATRERVDQLSEHDEERIKELAATKRALSGLGVDLEATRSQVAERERQLAELKALPDQLGHLQTELEQATTTGTRAREAMATVLAAIKDLTENVNERADSLSLMSLGGTKRFARTTMTLTKAVQRGDSDEETVQVAGEALRQVRDQVAAMHDQLSKFRSADIDQKQTINVLKSDATRSQSRVQELETIRVQLSSKVEELAKADASHSEQAEAAARKAQELDTELQRRAKEHQDHLRSKSSEVEEARAMTAATREQLIAERDGALAALEQLKGETEGLGLRIEELELELNALRAGSTTRIQELERTLDQREERLAEQAHQLEELKSDRMEAKGLQLRITNLSEKLSAATHEIMTLRAEHADHGGEDSAALQAALRDARNECSRLRRDVAKYERQLHQEQARSRSLEGSIVTKEASWKRRVDRIEERARHDQEALAETRDELRHLRQELAGAKARLRTATRH